MTVDARKYAVLMAALGYARGELSHGKPPRLLSRHLELDAMARVFRYGEGELEPAVATLADGRDESDEDDRLPLSADGFAPIVNERTFAIIAEAVAAIRTFLRRVEAGGWTAAEALAVEVATRQGVIAAKYGYDEGDLAMRPEEHLGESAPHNWWATTAS